MTDNFPEALTTARYALLRSHRRDGRPVDTPIWFVGNAERLVFRTKIGPKTKRLAARADVALTPCDHRGRATADAGWSAGSAAVLSGEAAQAANRLLHARYGWQWNVVPLLKIPGVVNVHRNLSLRQKWLRATDRGVWPDSVIIEIRPRDDHTSPRPST